MVGFEGKSKLQVIYEEAENKGYDAEINESPRERTERVVPLRQPACGGPRLCIYCAQLPEECSCAATAIDPEVGESMRSYTARCRTEANVQSQGAPAGGRTDGRPSREQKFEIREDVSDERDVFDTLLESPRSDLGKGKGRGKGESFIVQPLAMQ